MKAALITGITEQDGAHLAERLLGEVHGPCACNGIRFNHESPIRGETCVTRKINRARPHQVRPTGAPVRS